MFTSSVPQQLVITASAEKQISLGILTRHIAAYQGAVFSNRLLVLIDLDLGFQPTGGGTELARPREGGIVLQACVRSASGEIDQLADLFRGQHRARYAMLSRALHLGTHRLICRLGSSRPP